MIIQILITGRRSDLDIVGTRRLVFPYNFRGRIGREVFVQIHSACLVFRVAHIVVKKQYRTGVGVIQNELGIGFKVQRKRCYFVYAPLYSIKLKPGGVVKAEIVNLCVTNRNYGRRATIVICLESVIDTLGRGYRNLVGG